MVWVDCGCYLRVGIAFNSVVFEGSSFIDLLVSVCLLVWWL